jgi:hypothetical protein
MASLKSRSRSKSRTKSRSRSRSPRSPRSKRVLVLCQRKGGVTSGIDIREHLIPALEGYIQHFIQLPHTIEYMVDIKKPGNTANYNMQLNAEEPKTEQFIKDHSEYYDLVVLQTCPCKFIDFESIYQIMKKGAYMMITAFGYTGKMNPVTGALGMEHKYRKQTTLEFIETMFSKESNDERSYLFKKR